MSAALQAINHELTDLICRVLPSTVTIEGYSKDLSADSQGSGWIYAPELVVTNHHVIEGLANPMTVSPVGHAPMVGVVIGSDPENDIALIRVEGLAGIPLALAEEPPRLGELCVAIGSPHSYRESASLGIISGLSRQIRMPDGAVIEEMIQTDASVNPGNSGGPLINIQGCIVGMNTMGPAETVNMAIPAETIACVVPELEKHGRILRASMGISISLIQHCSGNGVQQAISVRKVKDPEQSQLKSGDLLLEFNGKRLKRRIDVIRALNRDVVDQHVEVLIERNGSEQMVRVLAQARSITKP
jgi:S1-C subfamily serine protease